jgi:hypothetical protein
MLYIYNMRLLANLSIRCIMS